MATTFKTDWRWVTPAETAKLVRKELKRSFPGTKFSVRTDGNALNVSWMEGPTGKAVDEALAPYKGGRFDGMIDLAYSVKSWLRPDGTAFHASSPGTAGSRGVHEGYDFEAPEPDAELVIFGAKYIFTKRYYRLETVLEAAAALGEAYGVTGPIETRVTRGSDPGVDWLPSFIEDAAVTGPDADHLFPYGFPSAVRMALASRPL